MIQDRSKPLTFHSLKDFLDETFYIPDYQRGYRWSKQEVEDLLNDFAYAHHKNPDLSYSMQPIVVKWHEEQNRWEVVDGQQRLTTLYIILQVLGCDKTYHLTYAVLDRSNRGITLLSAINDDDKNDINLAHMYDAYLMVNAWINEHCNGEQSFESKEELKKYCLEKLQFLWYRADLEDDSSGEEIFRRLNVGKIELTQSELIKALFLAKDNFKDNTINLREERAHQWDRYESMLQNDEFWLFITNDRNNNSPTRIEFLLKFLIKNFREELFPGIEAEDLDKKDALFRAYYNIYSQRKNTQAIWEKAGMVMETWDQWYNDVTFYHLIGFIIAYKDDDHQFSELSNLIKEWFRNPKDIFLDKHVISKISNLLTEFDIEKNYNINGCDHKKQAYPYLLLMNVLHILRQNLSHKQNKDYRQGIFYKFPFHLFKKEGDGKSKGWDIEHIDSASLNELDDDSSKEAWLTTSIFCAIETKGKESIIGLVKEINEFFDSDNPQNKKDVFDKLYKSFSEKLDLKYESDNKLKDRIYNYALLDATTNRTYKNALFPVKRQYIRDKECGNIFKLNWNKEKEYIVVDHIQSDSAFVPPCTKNVFLKAYSPVISTPMMWTAEDMKAYKNEIESIFNWFKKQNFYEK